MSEEIQRIKEHINSNKFLYIIGVDMIISGCKLDFEIKDKDLLKSISAEDCIITSICFRHVSTEKSALKCKICTTNLIEAYGFIDFKLKPMIIKTLIAMKNIKDLTIEDNIDCVIENEQEAIKQGARIITYGSKYMRLVVKIPDIEENQFENAMKKMLKSNYEFDNVLFWMHTSYSVTDIGKGKTRYDHIYQYSLLWTAFNALYSKLYHSLGDKKSVEKFATREYVVDYFEVLLNSHDTYELLKQLSLENLTLRENNNVSEELKKSLEDKDNKQISLNGMLCLYAVRNAIIHGSAVKEVDLCRTAFDILNPLIKLSIINEMSC